MRSLLAVLSLTVLASPAFTQNTERPRWEYQELTRSQVASLAPEDAKNKFVDGLNKLGADGWEVISSETAGRGVDPKVLLKRALTGQAKVQGGKRTDIQVVRLKYAKASETAQVLTAVFKKMGDITIAADDRTNSVLISDDASLLKEALGRIAELDRVAEGAAPVKLK